MHSVGPAGVRDQASGEGFAEITSGESRWQQGLVATCKDPTNEAERPKSPRPAPRLFDSNRSPTACQASGVKEIWLFCLRPAVKARRLIGISGPGALPQSDSHSIYSDSFVAQLPAGLRPPLFSYLIAHQMLARILCGSHKVGIGIATNWEPSIKLISLWRSSDSAWRRAVNPLRRYLVCPRIQLQRQTIR